MGTKGKSKGHIKSTINMIVDLNTRLIAINKHSKLCTFITGDDVAMFISMLKDEYENVPENVMEMSINDLINWYCKQQHEILINWYAQ